MATCDIETFEEIDMLNSTSPEELRSRWLPTNLVNGLDITGHPKGDGAICRVFDMSDGGSDAYTS